MNDADRESLETRVLLLAPTVNDGELTHAILARAGIACVGCFDPAHLCEQLTRGAGAVLIAQEAVYGSDDALAEWLGRQPAWSDLPVLMLARAGADFPAIAQAMDALGNVTILEQPTRDAALVSAVRTALRARQRQYQLRNQLVHRDRSAEQLTMAMAAAQAGSWQVNLTTGEFSASDRAIELHGLPPGTQLNHERALACLHPDDRASIEAALRLTIESGQPFRQEYRVPQPDGSIGWMSSQAERRGEGIYTCIIGLVQDVTERKEAEKRLRMSNDRFRLAADAVNGIIYEWDLLTGHVERQRGLYEVLGYHAAEVPPTGAWWREQIHPDDLKVIEQQFMEMAGNSVVGEYRVRHKDGRWLHVEDRAVLQRGDDGRPVKMVGCTVDITAQKQADAELRRRETFTSGILGSITDGFGVVCKDWRFTFANDELVRRIGKHRDEIVGTAIWEMFPDAVGNHAYVQLHRAMTERVTVEYEVCYEPWQRWMLEKVFPTADGGLAVYTRDITDRKRAEAALRESEERLRLAIAGSNLGTWHWDLGTGALDWSERCLEIFGILPRTAMSYEKFLDALHPEDRARADNAVQRALQGGSQYRIEFRSVWPDGSVHWAVSLGRAYYDAASVPTRMEGIAIDITEGKRAEEQVRLHRQLLQTMVNHLPAAVALVRGSDLTFQMVNPGYQAISPGKDIVGKTIAEVWPETHPLFGQRCRHVLETGETFEAIDERYEIQRDSDGPLETAYFSWSMHKVHLPDEVEPGLLLTIWETTAHKEIELALAERTELLNGVLESTTDVIFVKDLDGRMRLVNAAFAAAARSTPEQLVGKTDEDWFPPDVAAAVRQQDETVIAGGSPMQFEETLPVAGEARVFLTLKAPLRDRGSRVVGVLGIGRDITERKRAEEALRESEARLGGILRQSPAGIVQTDAAGCMTLVNPRWCEMLGYSELELLGRSIIDITHPSFVAATAAALGRLAAGGPDYQIEKAFCRKDGSMLSAQSNVAAIRSPAGEFLGMIGVVLDISERLRADDELRRLAIDLAEVDHRKDVFLATLAHELRNPLAPIRNGLQVMKLTKNKGEVFEQVRAMMDRQLSQLVRLVDDLLDVSRFAQGKMELRRERIALKAVIEAAVETSRPALEQGGHELAVVIPDEPIIVDADAARLAQVVSNLLHNSAKYTHRGGHVRLTAWREDGTAVVSVKDNGIGIPPAMLDRVFEMFTQVDRALEKTTGGLGIGLSLVKGLMEMHGGTIEARSDGEGTGSEFVVRLPVAMAVAAGPVHPNGQTGEVVPSALRRILVVDDNVDAADSLGQLLEMLGNEVRTAHDGQAGIEVAAQFHPDVVLMDIGMPKLNGYEAARRIRQYPWGKGMVLVALTGWGQEDDRKKSADAGFDHHLVKPVDTDALMKLMSSLKCADVLDVGAATAAMPRTVAAAPTPGA